MTPWILGDRFNTVYPHKGSIKALWETKWKFCCQKSIYPFHDGSIEDFEPIFDTLIAGNINDAFSDAYTNAFLPIADSLETRAAEALGYGHPDRAADLYRRAAVVLRISRFPYVSHASRPESSAKRAAFERQKDVYLKAAALWKPILTEVVIPHTHAAGADGAHIPLYIRLPEEASAEHRVPVVLIMTGLDGYRPDNSQRTHEIIDRGWATVIVEIPGTADSPADPADPDSPDRLWSSVLDYMATRPELDMSRVAVWGLSAGGFYAIRAACTHRERLAGSVAHGPGSHHFLGKEWLSRVNDHEYPFTITPCWAEKYGYSSTEEFEENAQKKFSLIETGVMDQPNCRLLLLNGVDDGVVPIEDSLVLFNHGGPKEGRFFEGTVHMGYPHTLPVAYKWLEEVLSPNKTALKN
ncbi:Heptaketide hydrolyase ayg1 [Penicillium macrosclerotiorum]|uniref:Heptaketide hydrolyase ayg1 n=1 Tax=Penicillium macrosclerotiorum TaxID=303699 RepID=UPI002547E726|nr:Heptaketide hydrolyase ayg1 [Penicillium macrosclerotiorum]KAJ5689248.1 Heptaketide hydrolyase ayg1 [Penicillium macrosclerotiorum]